MKIETILETILKQITEPNSHLSAFELGFQPIVTLSGQKLKLQLATPFPVHLLSSEFCSKVANTIKQALTKYEINIEFTHFIKAHQTQLVGKGLRGVKNVIAIASGKGGVGKSTVTVNLAAALQQSGARVGILDADIYGPSIPLMLGPVAPVEVVNDRYVPVSAHGMQAMSIGYLTEQDTALIWRGPMLAKSLLQMLDLTAWDNLDYLFIDLPPGTGDIQLSLVQKIPLAGAIIVTTPQGIATADASKALKMFAATNIPVLGLIENMALHECSHCGQHEAIFGNGGAAALAEQFDCKLLGQLPLHPAIGQACEEGTPLVLSGAAGLTNPFKQAALNTSLALSQRPLNYAGKLPPIVVT